MSDSQKEKAQKLKKEIKITKVTKTSTPNKMKRKKLMMVASRSGDMMCDEKYRWEVSSLKDVETSMELLVNKGWMVRAAITHGLPEKLWKTKKLNPEDMDDWVYGYVGVTNRRRVFKPFTTKIELKPLTRSIVKESDDFDKTTQKLSYKPPDYEGEEESYSDSNS